MHKLLVICGPTATGKTDLGLELANKYPSVIISADSRQVYKGMDIGTGKDIPPNNKTPIYGIDLINPNEEFSLSHYIKYAQNIVITSWKKSLLPIIVGGTGQYINGILNPPPTVSIPQNPELRSKFEKLSVTELVIQLEKLDQEKYHHLNHSDSLNPRRLTRAIEVATYLKNHQLPPPPSPLNTDLLTICLTAPLEIIDQKIQARVIKRFAQGMVNEVKSLSLDQLDSHLPAVHTLGYQQIIDYLMGKQSQAEATKAWIKAEQAYARRQLTWFKKQPHTHWFDVTQKTYPNNIVSLVEAWYSEPYDH